MVNSEELITAGYLTLQTRCRINRSLSPGLTVFDEQHNRDELP
jgi:hypothetical protein